MHLLVDENKKVIFYFSPKCASIHVMNLFNYLSNRLENCIQTTNKPFSPFTLCNMKVQDTFPENISEYKMIVFIRNPYKRLASSFHFLYDPTVGVCGKMHQFRAWPENLRRTFRNFVEERCTLGRTCKPKMIELHFPPNCQRKIYALCECRINCLHTLQQVEKPLLEVKNIHKIFDVENIDYEYLELLFEKKIPDDVRKYRGPHANANTEPIDVNVYDLDMSDYVGKRPTVAQYYDKDIFDKVTDFYKDDLDYFSAHGFVYGVDGF